MGHDDDAAQVPSGETFLINQPSDLMPGDKSASIFLFDPQLRKDQSKSRVELDATINS